MIKDWQTVAVILGVVATLALLVRDLFRKPKAEPIQENPVISALVSSLQEDGKERRDFMRQLVNVQNEVALSLKEQALSNKYNTTRTEELHKQTHSKLEEITENQLMIRDTIEKAAKNWNKAA